MNTAGLLQSTLDDLSKAVCTDDFALYEKHVLLPFNLVTDRANLYVTTLQDLEEGFDAFVCGLQAKGATSMIRLVETAHFTARGDIHGTYVTHLMGGGLPVAPPFRSEVTLRNVDGIWKACTISNSMQNASWPIMIPQIEDHTSHFSAE